MRIVAVTLMLLALSGCSSALPEAPPTVRVREVAPPLERYRILYQYRGVEVIPEFAAIERDGEYVVAPMP